MQKKIAVITSFLFRKINFFYALLLITIVGAYCTYYIFLTCKQWDVIDTPGYQEVIHHQVNKSGWEGGWSLVGSGNSNRSSITISDLTKKGFLFIIEAQSGRAIGKLTNIISPTHGTKTAVAGTMTLQGGVAHWTDDTTACTATFTLSGTGSALDVQTTCDANYAGHGVHFEGNYKKI
jgi:hypothetical protein